MIMDVRSKPIESELVNEPLRQSCTDFATQHSLEELVLNCQYVTMRYGQVNG